MNAATRSITDRDREIARRVWMRRRMREMTRDDLAQKIGTTHQQIHKYENALNRISAGRLAEIAEALDTPIGYFYEPAPGQRKAA